MKNETIEGCSDLKKEDLKIFDCAISAGEGKRVISPMGHIKMLGAIQPLFQEQYLKTVNCAENTSVKGN